MPSGGMVGGRGGRGKCEVGAQRSEEKKGNGKGKGKRKRKIKKREAKINREGKKTRSIPFPLPHWHPLVALFA